MRSALALLLLAFAMSAGVALFLSQCAAQEHQATLTVEARVEQVGVVFAEWVDEGREVEAGGYEGRRDSVRLLLQPRGEVRCVILLRGEDAEEVRTAREELRVALGAGSRGWSSAR